MTIKEIWKEIDGYDGLYDIDRFTERIRKYIPIGEIEKKSFGEVFTPFELINKILDTLPVDVWNNPNLKWGDFCNGVGNFMVIIIKRLMKGLETWEPDENKRYKHIIENMIYVAEFQIKNMFVWMVSVDPKNEYKLNLFRGSTLSDDFKNHMKNVWKISKFDILVGNPPYHIKKEGFDKTQPLWHLFVEKYISLLNDCGYTCIVHPSGWRNVAGVFKKTQNLLKSKEILYLKLNNFKSGQDVFNAAIAFDYYCLRNKENKNFSSKVIFEDNKEFDVDLSKLEFIPNESFDEVIKLIAKDGEEKVEIINNSAYHHQHSHMNKQISQEFKYPCVYGVKSPDKGNIPSLYYSNCNNKGHFNLPKVIFASGASGVFVDSEGDYGLTEFASAIVDKPENLENIKKALQTERFIRNIMGFKNSLGDKYNRKIISTFRKDFWKDFLNVDIILDKFQKGEYKIGTNKNYTKPKKSDIKTNELSLHASKNKKDK